MRHGLGVLTNIRDGKKMTGMWKKGILVQAKGIGEYLSIGLVER